jgi:hypothetical protein
MKKSTATEGIVHDYLREKAEELKTSNKASIDKKVAVATARDLLVIEELDKTLSKVFSKGWCCPPKYTGKRKHTPYKRIVNVILSDLHIGAHLDPAECPLEYNTLQESRRLGRVAQQVADYKTEYRGESRLIIHVLGDIIQGMLGHHARDGEPLTYQFAAALHYFVQFILFAAQNYPSVEIDMVPGNHGRNIAVHPDRAIHQRWDSIENMLYLAIKPAVLNSGVTNCIFNIPKTPYYVAQLFDAKLFGNHGDVGLKPGYVGKTIQVANLEKQIYKWNSARHIGGPFRIFVVGHLHTATMISLPGNVTLLTNGCLVPPDPFALSVGASDNTCSQWLFESTEKHPMGDGRCIIVDGAEDDSSYNDIISLFNGV